MAEDGSLETYTALIVSNYLANNKVETDKIAAIITDVHAALTKVGRPEPEAEAEDKPDKAAIRKSLGSDYLTSFIDQRPYKSLKRHLAGHDLTPGEYRARYGLPSDYPMVAPNYSAQRSALAKSLGLGRGGIGGKPVPPSTPEAALAKRGRKAR